ncbi:MAG TPA: cell division protein ZapA [Spirochaetota bacterium]|nr:cell division protein ZapA [Spirochaetota bacterium]HNT11612.1 cell division protein ZapA [Spirochaetota bacterium]HNV47711.1 cell division protein ZapA [Spirochaetota bacterium]HOS41710.1 cell division protein ZapA [Spirochaetota bacterium]HPU88639.1 cell division protein ZapA [Spirochaetota bacterium]
MDNKIRVRIFGSYYNIQGEAPPEYILTLAEFVNDKMDEVSAGLPGASAAQVAILAALNIADEYYQIRDSKTNVSDAIEKRARALISMLDEGLIGDVLNAAETPRR